ncbi:MDR family MFS transporter [Streptomyces sp. NRRL B-24484]|uniref:MDR family MFS transporter n=1 Tax=Streptomyces sp. NRRL B-24484 TaxID=1463833 RepID=UPI00099784D8|nr:MDR family MFS transporter [Streptomyces sp. NRRL B-24484]
MTHRQVLEALSGLLLGLFVAVLSSTVVSNALPTILTDLHGGESAYTWVITATLLSLTASTPIWGKLSDLVSKKLLVQIALVIYILSSALAGLSQNTGELIACRVLQGIGAGGVTALAQICLAAMVTPRERGRYSGYFGAVFALATIGGPLIGGVIVDTDWLGWRWCFYVGIPFSLLAIVVLQRTLRLPVAPRRKARIDYLGALLVTAAASLLMIWVSLAGKNYDWVSWQSAAMLAGAAVLAVLFVAAERRAAEPVIPLHLFRHRTVTLSAVASVLVGVGMYGATTFLSQYFQLAKEKSPTMAGLLTLPMILGLAVSSTVAGKLITRYGRWKGYLVAGTLLLAVGFGLLGTARADTAYGLLALYMAVAGVGLGLTMQNLVLAVQNTVPREELGSASSVVTFFRTMGGAIGVSALGALMADRVARYLAENLARAGVRPTGSALGGGEIPDLHRLPAPIVPLVTDAFGHGVGVVFLLAAPFALLAFLVVLFIRETPLRTTMDAPAERALELVED